MPTSKKVPKPSRTNKPRKGGQTTPGAPTNEGAKPDISPRPREQARIAARQAVASWLRNANTRPWQNPRTAEEAEVGDVNEIVGGATDGLSTEASATHGASRDWPRWTLGAAITSWQRRVSMLGHQNAADTELAEARDVERIVRAAAYALADGDRAALHKLGLAARRYLKTQDVAALRRREPRFLGPEAARLLDEGSGEDQGGTNEPAAIVLDFGDAARILSASDNYAAAGEAPWGRAHFVAWARENLARMLARRAHDDTLAQMLCWWLKSPECLRQLPPAGQEPDQAAIVQRVTHERGKLEESEAEVERVLLNVLRACSVRRDVADAATESILVKALCAGGPRTSKATADKERELERNLRACGVREHAAKAGAKVALVVGDCAAGARNEASEVGAKCALVGALRGPGVREDTAERQATLALREAVKAGRKYALAAEGTAERMLVNALRACGVAKDAAEGLFAAEARAAERGKRR